MPPPNRSRPTPEKEAKDWIAQTAAEMHGIFEPRRQEHPVQRVLPRLLLIVLGFVVVAMLPVLAASLLPR
jgi:hypothetical protein